MDKAAVFGTADGGSIPPKGARARSSIGRASRRHLIGLLAQVVEQLPLKESVPSSSLGQLTIDVAGRFSARSH